MQDRYFGDVGDFGKYALLRRLCSRAEEVPVRLGVVWCLYPDETHTNDGRHVSYLYGTEFRNLDDDLLAVLRSIVESGRRCVAAVESSGLLPSHTVFCDAPVSPTSVSRHSRDYRSGYRAEWLDQCFDLTESSNLVFFDPDNGLEVASVPKHHPSAGKYIYWDELARFWERRQTLLVYHHLNRTTSIARQVEVLTDRFLVELGGAAVTPLVFRRGSCRVFWLAHHGCTTGVELERRANDMLRSDWSKHFALEQRQALGQAHEPARCPASRPDDR